MGMASHAALYRLIAERDRYRCAYCLITEVNCGLQMHVDHIIPEAAGCSDPIMAGKPVIRCTRLTVEGILNLLARGATGAKILDEHTGLTHEDIRACRLFAAQSLENTLFMPLAMEPA